MLKKIGQFLKDYFAGFFLLVLILGSNYALFHPGFFFLHDFTHASRIVEMAQALQDGQFPVRWSADLGYGFGMPLFNFYAPLPYFVGAILWLLHLPIITILKLLYFLLTFFTTLGAYRLGRRLGNRKTGIMLAIVFALTPYRAVNLFVRGAMSEVWAMAFFPWILDAIVASIQAKKKDQKPFYLQLILSLAAVMLSHNLSALMFYPASAVFALAYSFFHEKYAWAQVWQKIKPLAICYLTAITLTAFYSLPAFLEKDQTIIQSIFSGYFYYSNHFLYIRQFFTPNWGYGGSAWGPDDNMSFFLGYAQIAALLLLVVVGGSKLWQLSRQRRLATIFLDQTLLLLFVAAMSVTLLFFSLMKSEFFWQKIALLPFIQFPWRFLSPASIFLALVVALLPQLINSKVWRSIIMTGLIILSLFNVQFFHPEKYLADATALYYTDPLRIQLQMSETLPDYIPRQMANQATLKILVTTAPAMWSNETILDARSTIMIDKSQEKLYKVVLLQPATIQFKIANFPGWQAELDGQKVSIGVNPDIGNIQLAVPAGEHLVGLRFTEQTWPRLVGDILSGLTLLALLGVFSPFQTKELDKKNRQSKITD